MQLLVAMPAKFKENDREAFAELYRAHSQAVYRFALHMTGDPAKAAEVTQEVFVWLIHHQQDYCPERGTMAAFLAGVARQFVRRQQRGERRWLTFDDTTVAAAEPDIERAIDAEALRKAVAALPMRYREAVVLCDLEGHSYEEAAAVAGCAVGTIRSRLHRGRELLARKYQRSPWQGSMRPPADRPASRNGEHGKFELPEKKP
jgi:RNA polymerase sigma-70 factor (ECF subfamily)